MSGYLDYYKHGGLSINPPDLVYISNESFIGKVGDGLKRLLKYITDLFKKVFTWIKDKINNVLKSRIFKNKIDKIKKRATIVKNVAKDGKLLAKVLSIILTRFSNSKSTEDYKDNLRNHFKQYNIDYTQFLFDYRTGKLFNLNTLISKCSTTIDKLIGLVDDGMAGKVGLDHQVVFNQMSQLGSFWSSSDDLEDVLRLTNIDEIYKYIDALDNHVRECETFYNKYKNIINQKILLLTRSNDSNSVADSVSMLNLALKVSMVPLGVILLYANLISVVDNEFNSMEYISDKVDLSEELYHLSSDDDLGGSSKYLYPIISENMKKEYVPPRVSFSPSVRECVPGIHHHLKAYDEFENGVYTKYIYLYKGQPDKNTRKLKDELSDVLIFDRDLSNEIVILTPIKIYKVGRIKLEYTDHGNSYKYKSHEVL